MSSGVLVNSNNVLLKTEKERALQRFLGTSNTILHKIKDATTYWVSFELNAKKMSPRGEVTSVVD